MKKTFLLLSIFLLFISFKNKDEEIKKDSFNLIVTAKHFPDSTKVYLYNRDIDSNIDTAYVINESFKFSGKVDLPSLCYLNFFDKENKHIAYNYFFLENEDISIKGDYSDFLKAKVTGSTQTDLKTKYYSVSVKNRIDFLFSNANNQMTLHELLYKKKEISKDSLMLFYKRLDSINSNSIKGQELLAYAKSKDIKIGDKFRDIVGNDLNGIQHRLSDYSGKVILLDFWGAGCSPCRKQNKKEFPKLVQKYNQKDFILISYYLGKNKKVWKIVSEEDKINWLNISDLKQFGSENVSKYAVTAVPNSFLIDQNGIVKKSFVGFYEGNNRIEKEIDKLLK